MINGSVRASSQSQPPPSSQSPVPTHTRSLSPDYWSLAPALTNQVSYITTLTSPSLSLSGLPFTTPNSAQTQFALFQTPAIVKHFSFIPGSSSPSILQRNTLISTQLRSIELTLSPRLSPAICSSRSASIQAINLPVVSLSCYSRLRLWQDHWKFEVFVSLICF